MTRRISQWLWPCALAIGSATFAFDSPAIAQNPIGSDLRGVFNGQSDVSVRRPAVSSTVAPSSATPSVSLPNPLAPAMRTPESINMDLEFGPTPSMSGLESSVPSTRGHNSNFDANRDRLFSELAGEFETFNRLGNLVKRVAQLVGPSVMHIEAHKTDTSSGKRESYDEAGSGVVIEIGGESWVLTNRHVIAGSKPQEIMLRTRDGQEFSPSRVLADASTDIAVLKIEPKLGSISSEIPPARLGNSGQVEIGDFVIAIGSPFGLSHSVTFGIVSAKGRRDLSLGEQKIDLQDFFQTDAAINPGNSGGPLLNLRGEVVALNTAIASSSGGSEGIGFAIPINMGIQVAEQLVRYGKLRRGYLGVTLEPEFTPADMMAAGYQASGGALVKNVRAGSPAASARLQRGDIIVEFDGRPVDDDDHLVAQVGLTPLGASVPMIIYRDGKLYSTDVVLVDLE